MTDTEKQAKAPVIVAIRPLTRLMMVILLIISQLLILFNVLGLYPGFKGLYLARWSYNQSNPLLNLSNYANSASYSSPVLSNIEVYASYDIVCTKYYQEYKCTHNKNISDLHPVPSALISNNGYTQEINILDIAFSFTKRRWFAFAIFTLCVVGLALICQIPCLGLVIRTDAKFLKIASWMSTIASGITVIWCSVMFGRVITSLDGFNATINFGPIDGGISGATVAFYWIVLVCMIAAAALIYPTVRNDTQINHVWAKEDS